MKHIVTNLNDVNELVMFSNFVLGNFYFDTFFGELDVELFMFVNSDTQSELLHCTHIVDPNCTLVDINYVGTRVLNEVVAFRNLRKSFQTNL